MKLGAVDGGAEAHDARRLLAGLCQIPADDAEVLGAAEEVAAARRPGKVLDLTHMAAEDTGKTVCFDIKEDDGAVNLADVQRVCVGGSAGETCPAGSEEVAFAVEADLQESAQEEGGSHRG